MTEKQYRFELEGLSPLIMHADDVEWADAMEAARSAIKSGDKKNFKGGDDRCPPETWKGSLYVDDKAVALPTENLRACLMKAGAKIELKGKLTYKSLTQSAILFDDLYAQLECGGKTITRQIIDSIKGTFAEQADAAKKHGFRLLVKRASIGQAKHVRVRPIFEKWKAAGTFTVVDEQITDELLNTLWGKAGLFVGVGDWRPGASRSPGPYGRFKTTLKAI
jgi:hypothetical protein